VVADLLTRPLTPGDLPALCWVVREQRRLIETDYVRLGQQKAVIESRDQEIAALRALLADGDDADWDLGDERRW
jgi:hypothetical protein